MQPLARMEWIDRRIARALAQTDLLYLNRVIPQVVEHGANAVATSMYPWSATVNAAFADAIAQSWHDADAQIKGILRRLGNAVLLGQTGKPKTFAARLRTYAGAETEALDLLTGAQRVVVPEDSIRAYVAKRIPPLKYDVQQKRRERLRDIVANHLQRGESGRRLAQAIRAEGFEKFRNHSELIARTESATLYNLGIAARGEQSGIVCGYEFQGIHDARECEICEGLDGQKFASGEIDGIDPPLHGRCRCHLVPITLFDDGVDPDGLQSAADYLADDDTPNPPEGWGGVDLSGFPPRETLGDFYKPLETAPQDDIRRLYADIDAECRARWGVSWKDL